MMLMKHASVSHEILGVVDGIGGLEESADHQAEVLLLLSSFAFILPAFVAWRTTRSWHTSFFATLAVVCALHQACSDGMPPLMGTRFTCKPVAASLLSHFHTSMVCVCSLQLAFLVLGPEDPRMQWIGHQSSVPIAQAPWDVMVVARALPIVAICLFQCVHAHWGLVDAPWHAALLIESLLIVCPALFWMHPLRRGKAPEVLLRAKFWRRLMRHGLASLAALLWALTILGAPGHQLLSAVLQLLVAVLACHALQSVLAAPGALTAREPEPAPAGESHIAHVLLGSVALVSLPAVALAGGFGWCGDGPASPGWLPSAVDVPCKTWAHFVATAAVPTAAAASAAFWLIGSTGTSSPPWATSSRDDVTVEMAQVDPRKQLGCRLGYSGIGFGLLGGLVMHISPSNDGTHLLFGVVALSLLAIAMTLTVLSSTSVSPGFWLRRNFTVFVCSPLLSVHALLILADQLIPKKHALPSVIHAFAEYITICLLALWPLTWAAEVQETWHAKASGTFHWPATSWRFA